MLATDLVYNKDSYDTTLEWSDETLAMLWLTRADLTAEVDEDTCLYFEPVEDACTPHHDYGCDYDCDYGRYYGCDYYLPNG